MEHLGDVKRLSFESGVTVKEIASKLGVSTQSLYRSMRSGLSLDKFIKIVRICGFRLLVIDKDRNIILEVKE